MACEYIANQLQTVALNAPIVFYDSIPCQRGLIYHEDGTGVFQIRGRNNNIRRCNCCQEDTSDYLVRFVGNVAIPEDGTVGPIALAITIGGEPIDASRSIVTPAAVGDFWNIVTEKVVKIPCGCCPSVSVEYVNGSVNDPTFVPTPVIQQINGKLTIYSDFD